MSDEAEDPATRIRRVLDTGIAAIEKQMEALTKGKLDGGKTSKVVTLVKDLATIMSHVRRYDEAQRNAARRLTPAVVIEYLRGLTPERKLFIFRETGAQEEEDGANGSVLS